MKIKVSILGSTKKYSNEEEFFVELDHLSTVNDVIQKIIELKPNIQSVMKYLSVSVNNTLVAKTHQVSDNDEIALFSRPGGG
jgi:molybdopterin converting factor small subunit